MQHLYGPRVHIVDTAATHGLLAELCHEATVQPRINKLVELLYTHLINQALSTQLELEDFSQETRMSKYHPTVQLKGQRISANQRAIVVNLARAGTHPSHICYEFLHHFLRAELIRQDHIFAARQVDQSEHVTGTSLGATKIGGDVTGGCVFIPDPMGATGNTMVATLDHYKKLVRGPAKRFIALHLIVTPEYLKKITSTHPDTEIYALRVDRGMSPVEILNTVPGTHWDLEKGLNDKDYIVPGGGGFGELMNNAYV